MSEVVAIGILHTLAGIQLAVWLAGLSYLGRVHKRGRVADSDQGLDHAKTFAIEPELDGDRPANSKPVLTGEIELQGEPEDLSQAAASALVGQVTNQLGLIQIVTRTDDELVFRGAPEGPPMTQQGRYGRILDEGRLSFHQIGGGRTRVGYAVSYHRKDWLLQVATLVHILGLIVLAALYFGLLSFVANAANPQVRVQVIQMLQGIHLIWPVFLLGSLYQMRIRMLRGSLETALHNLPHTMVHA